MTLEEKVAQDAQEASVAAAAAGNDMTMLPSNGIPPLKDDVKHVAVIGPNASVCDVP